MKGKMLILHPDVEAVDAIRFDGPISIEALQAAVGGGNIESVPYWTQWGHRRERAWVICNEEGKLKGMPLNVFATALWYNAAPQMRGVDTLHGPVVVLTGDEEFMDAL